MLKIEILEPQLMPRQLLIDTAAFLMKIAGAELRPVAAVKTPVEPFDEGVTKSYVDSQMLEGTAVPFSAKQYVPPAPIEPLLDLTPPPAPISDFNPFTPPLGATVATVAPIDPDLTPRPVKIGVDLDVNGIPWDARIHTRTKSKNANGTWKVQRGIDLHKVEEISQQLKSVMEIPPTPLDGNAPVLDWNSFMLKITGLIGQNKLTRAQVTEAVNSVGLPSIPVLSTRPDLIPAVSLYIDNMI